MPAQAEPKTNPKMTPQNDFSSTSRTTQKPPKSCPESPKIPLGC